MVSTLKIYSRLGKGFKELHCDKCDKLIGFVSRKYYIRHNYLCQRCYTIKLEEL